jgi:hypothetical protein
MHVIYFILEHIAQNQKHWLFERRSLKKLFNFIFSTGIINLEPHKYMFKSHLVGRGRCNIYLFADTNTKFIFKGMSFWTGLIMNCKSLIKMCNSLVLKIYSSLLVFTTSIKYFHSIFYYLLITPIN